MGKTLAKQRKKAAKASLEDGPVGGGPGGPLAAIAKRLKYTLPTRKRVKLVPFISEALAASAWDDARTLLCLLQQQQDAAAAVAARPKQHQTSAMPDSHAEMPKLGAIMRWVRAADLAGTEAIAASLLAAIMRVAAGPPTTTAAAAAAEAGSASQQQAAVDPASGAALPVHRFPPWTPLHPAAAPSAAAPSAAAAVDPAAARGATDATSIPPAAAAATAAAGAAADGTAAAASNDSTIDGPPRRCSYAGRFAVVPLPPEYAGTNANGATAAATLLTAAAAAAAAPTLLPNLVRDLTMFCTEPGTIRFDAPHPPEPLLGRPAAARVEVPRVPGAFVVLGALSRGECRQIVACAEEMGFTVDPDYSFSAAAKAAAAGGGTGLAGGGGSAARNGGSGGGERGAAGCVWLADESLQGPLYERLSHLLPQRLCGGELAGLNARWRLYRYDKGAVYRPHVDGAWPGSSLRDGKYEFDAYGDRWSRLTFLVYLNDDFEGGATTFYTPAAPGSSCCLEAHSVRPVAGNVLVFPHGDTQGSLVHEGSAVTRGAKYVIRTEVLYKLAPGVSSGGAGAPQPAMQLPAKARAAPAGAGARR